MPFRPRKKKSRQAKFHRCSWCGAQVRRRSARCKHAPSGRSPSELNGRVAMAGERSGIAPAPVCIRINPSPGAGRPVCPIAASG